MNQERRKQWEEIDEPEHILIKDSIGNGHSKSLRTRKGIEKKENQSDDRDKRRRAYPFHLKFFIHFELVLCLELMIERVVMCGGKLKKKTEILPNIIDTEEGA